MRVQMSHRLYLCTRIIQPHDDGFESDLVGNSNFRYNRYRVVNLYLIAALHSAIVFKKGGKGVPFFHGHCQVCADT